MNSKADQIFLTLKFCDEELKIQQPTYVLQDNFLYGDNFKIHISELTLENVVLKQIKFQRLGCLNLHNPDIGIIMYGLKEEIQIWFNHLRKYCFQTQIFKYYKILQQINTPGYGRAYKVLDLRNKQTLSMKVYKQFDKEIQVLRTLEHRTCLKFYEMFKERNQVYVILDYIEGGELLNFLQINKRNLNELAIRDIALTLFTGLKYIHSLNIIHRNINQDNILMRQNQNKIDIIFSDFSYADFYQENCYYEKKYMGQHFSAPELLSTYDQRVDVYSVGVVLYLLITGEYPNEEQDESFDQIIEPTFGVNYSLNLNNLSVEGIEFITSCLTEDYKQRPTAQQALQHNWFKIKEFTSALNVQSQFQFVKTLTRAHTSKPCDNSFSSYQSNDETDIEALVKQYQFHTQQKPE